MQGPRGGLYVIANGRRLKPAATTASGSCEVISQVRALAAGTKPGPAARLRAVAPLVARLAKRDGDVGEVFFAADEMLDRLAKPWADRDARLVLGAIAEVIDERKWC